MNNHLKIASRAPVGSWICLFHMLGPHSRSWTVSRGLFHIFPLEATGILWEAGTAVDRRLLCTNHPPALQGLGMALWRMDSGSSLFIYCSGRWQCSKKASPWPPPPHCSRFLDKWRFLSHWLARKEPQSSLCLKEDFCAGKDILMVPNEH